MILLLSKKLLYISALAILSVLALTLGQIIVQSDPSKFLVSALMVLLGVVTLRRREYGLVILVIVMTNFLGLFLVSDMPSIKLPFGRFLISDLIFFLIMALFLHFMYSRKLTWKKVPLNKPLMALLLMTFLQASRSIIVYSENIHYVLRLTRPLVYYSIFFVVLNEIRREKQLNRFLKVFVLAGVIAGIIGLLQLAFGWSFGGRGGRWVTQAGITFYRDYSFTSMVTATFILLLFVRPYLISKKGKILATAALGFLAFNLLITASRGLWISVLGGVLVGFLFTPYRLVVRNLAVILIAGICAIVFLIKINPSILEGIIIRAKYFQHDLLEEKGTLGKRLLISHRLWNKAKSESLILGVGMQYEEPIVPSYQGIVSWTEQPELAYTGTDIGLANIPFRFGIVGVFVFGWIFVTFFQRCFYLVRCMEHSLWRALLISFIAINVQFILQSFVGNIWFRFQELIVPVVSWALMELIWEFHSREEPKFAGNRS